MTEHDPDPDTADAAPLARYYTRVREDPWALQRVAVRSRVMAAWRAVLARRGHLEIDTPCYSAAGGRAEHPLGMRALLTCDIARVHNLSRVSTSGGPSTRCALYEADADQDTMRSLTVDLLEAVAPLSTRAAELIPTMHTPGVSVYTAVSEALGTTITPETAPEWLRVVTAEHGITAPHDACTADLVLAVYEQQVLPTIQQPQVYVDFPTAAFPLAQADTHDPRMTHRWALATAGGEIATATREETDLATVQHRQRTTTITPHPAQGLDPAWQAVFASGMPPAAGLTLHLDQLMMLMDTDHDQHRPVMPETES